MAHASPSVRALADWHSLEGALDRWASYGALAVAGAGAILLLVLR